MYEIGKAEIDAVAKVINSGQLFRYRGGEGGWCDKFEAALGKRTGVKYALMTNSGTSALICGLVGLGVGPGDEVIVPAYTFMASALAALAAGAVPVIAEVDETLMIDPADVQRKITRYTKAIMPVHMIGRACNMDKIMRIARKHKLAVIEDACQAVGGSYKTRPLGSIGHVGAFSFNYFKNIVCGDGGAVLTNDMVVYDRALIHHDGGAVFRKYADKVGTPFFAGQTYRASEILGAIMFEQLKRLDRILGRLRARQAAMKDILGKSAGFRISPTNEATGDCGSALPLLFETAKEAMAFVERNRGKLGMLRPIDSSRHVYFDWEPIMKRRGSHHPKLNPFRLAKRKITYTKGMCPQSLDILARTVYLGTPYAATLAQVRSIARTLIR